MLVIILIITNNNKMCDFVSQYVIFHKFSCSTFVQSTVLLALARCWLQPTPRAAVEALPHSLRGAPGDVSSLQVLLLTDLK